MQRLPRLGEITRLGIRAGGEAGDRTAPVPVITSDAADTVYAAFLVRITFTNGPGGDPEDVTGFGSVDITVGGGTVTDFTAVSGSVYDAEITPSASGTVTIGVAAGVCVDGSDNANVEGNTLTRTKASSKTNDIVTNHATGLIGYWTCYQNANDSSVEENHGADIDTPSYAADGIGDGNTSIGLDGSNNGINLFSAGLAADFSATLLTLCVWLKVSAGSIWTDGNVRGVCRIYVNGSNFVSIQRAVPANTLRCFYVAGGTTKYVDVSTSTTDWLCVMMVVDVAGDSLEVFAGGVSQGTASGLGVWAGTPTAAYIGAHSAVPVEVWSGSLAHVALWTVDKSASAAALAVANPS